MKKEKNKKKKMKMVIKRKLKRVIEAFELASVHIIEADFMVLLRNLIHEAFRESILYYLVIFFYNNSQYCCC